MSATASAWPAPRASSRIACCRATRWSRRGRRATRGGEWRPPSSAAPTTWWRPSATAAPDGSSALLEQRVDLGAENLVGDGAHVLAADAAVARHEERLGYSVHAIVDGDL